MPQSDELEKAIRKGLRQVGASWALSTIRCVQEIGEIARHIRPLLEKAENRGYEKGWKAQRRFLPGELEQARQKERERLLSDATRIAQGTCDPCVCLAFDLFIKKHAAAAAIRQDPDDAGD